MVKPPSKLKKRAKLVARIKRDFNFFGGTYLHQEYNIDLFTVTVYADCLTTDPVEQQIALGRIKYLFSKRLENCIFINKDNKKIIDGFSSLGIKVSSLPVDPYDQAIAISLLKKINSIVDGRFIVTSITFKSHMSDRVEYLVDNETPYKSFENPEDWWNSSGLSIDNKLKNRKEKVVQLTRNHDWNDINLGWICKTKEHSEITFTLETEKT